MSSLIEFVRGRLDEEEEWLRRFATSSDSRPWREHAAKRARLELLTAADPLCHCHERAMAAVMLDMAAVMLDAGIWRDHPDFDPSWKLP